MFLVTSLTTPRPNWAGLPVTSSVVLTTTSVASPRSSSTKRIVADAVPAPLVFMPDASSSSIPAAASISTSRAVAV